MDDKEGSGTEGDAEGEDEGDTGFIWLSLIDEVSEITRQPFPEVWSMNIYLFFNYLSYSRDKKQKEKEALEKIKKS